MMSKKLIIISSGGHAMALVDAILSMEYSIIGFTSLDYNKGEFINSIEVLGNDEIILNYDPSSILLVNGIGSIPGNNISRKKVFDFFKSKGYSFLNVIHNSCILSNNIILEEGVQVMAGAIIQNGVKIGANSIINTGAIIDHDTFIGSNCHVSPGAIICGSVKCEKNTHIGAGAVIIQKMNIGSNSVVAAGATIYKKVKANSVIKSSSMKVSKNNI